MLNLFRTNQLLFSILLLIYIGILHVGVFVYPVAWQPVEFGIFSRWVYDAIGATGTLPSIIVMVLLFIQGTAINVIAANHRLADTVTLYPGLFYILIASALPEFLHLSPLHMANTFLLIAISELLKVYKNPSCANNIFNVGFWVAVASLFYPSYLIFIIFGFTGLNSLRAFNFKEWLMLLSGGIVPYILMGTYIFWIDQFDAFFNLQFVQSFAFLDFQAQPVPDVYFKITFVDLFLLVAVFSYSLYVFKKVMQVQKKIGILYWALFWSGTTLLFQADIQLDHMLIMAIPLGIMISLNFQAITNRWAEALHLLIWVVILFFQYQEILLPT